MLFQAVTTEWTKFYFNTEQLIGGWSCCRGLICLWFVKAQLKFVLNIYRKIVDKTLKSYFLCGQINSVFCTQIYWPKLRDYRCQSPEFAPKIKSELSLIIYTAAPTSVEPRENDQGNIENQESCNISNRLLGATDFVWVVFRLKTMQKLNSCPGKHIGFTAQTEALYVRAVCDTCDPENILRPREKAVISEMFEWNLAWDIGGRDISEACRGQPVWWQTGCVLTTDLHGGYLMHDGGGEVFINTVWMCQAGGTDGAIRQSEGEIKQVIWFCRKAERGYGCQVEATFAGWSGEKKKKSSVLPLQKVSAVDWGYFLWWADERSYSHSVELPGWVVACLTSEIFGAIWEKKALRKEG